MSRRHMKIGLAALSVTAAVWAVLGLGLGNVGLQQSVRIGPQVLVGDYATVTALASAVALIGAAMVSAIGRLTGREAVLLPGYVVGVIAAMSWLVAPVLIGELTIEHWPLIFVVLSVLGLLPLGALGGGLIPALWRARREARSP